MAIQQRTRLAEKGENIAAHLGRMGWAPILSRSIVSSLSIIIDHRNYLDFHIYSFGQRRDLDGGTGWRILLKIRTINFVNGLEIAEVGEEDRCLHDTVESQSLSSQDTRNVVHYAPGLHSDVALDDLAGCWVERNLPTAKKEASVANRLRVRTNRARSFACGNDFLHGWRV